MIIYTFENQTQIVVEHIVYLSCLHLETTAQVISQDASILSSVVMSIKVMYTHIYVSHTRTQTQYTLTHWYSPRATILLHQKLLWHIEVIRTDIMFCKLLLYSQTPKLHFSKLQKSWKRSKVLNNTDYILSCFFVNMTVCYDVINFQHAKSFHREICSLFLSPIFNLYIYPNLYRNILPLCQYFIILAIFIYNLHRLVM